METKRNIKKIIISCLILMSLIFILLYVSIFENNAFRKMGLEPSISVYPNKNLKNGDFIIISWENISKPSIDDIIAMLCDKDLNQNLYNRKYVIFKKRKLNDHGKVKFKVYYHRSDCVFFYAQKDNKKKYHPIARSKPIKFIYSKGEPMSIHISLTNNPNEMKVMWISDWKDQTKLFYGSKDQLKKTALSRVDTYSASDMCEEVANTSLFIDPGYIHSALLINLPMDSEIFYKISGSSNQNQVYSFKTRISNKLKVPTSIIVYGDLSTDTAKEAYRTIDSVNVLRDSEIKPNLILHVGDISYARGKAYIWDAFGNMIQKVSAYLPYMVAIGNHEHLYKYGQQNDPSGEPSNYLSFDDVSKGSGGECSVPMIKRYSAPENGNKIFWYSMDYGLVHIIVLCSELRIDTYSRQYNWLLLDLKSIDRSITPWVIVSMHRPMYSTDGGSYFVSKNIKKSIEPLLLQFKVDFVVNGHIHYYERTCHIREGKCRDRNKQKWSLPYFTLGTGGAILQSLPEVYPDWSIKNIKSYGFGKFDFINYTHLNFYFISSLDRSILDRQTFIKT